jgi:RNA polymerase sigma-70 factor (ECF subfamily)
MSSLADRLAESAEPHRYELLAYCYRMTGSFHDAQDLVQETMVRAWRSAHTFDGGRGSLRTWLYAIATRVCLTALADARRRELPADLSEPSTVVDIHRITANDDMAWLEPFPVGAAASPDPAAMAAQRDGVRLAFVAALQHLAPLQRAVLILRDVLVFSAADAAALLETTPAAVNSALQRAHAKIADVAPADQDAVDVTEPEQRELLARYVAAFENHDVSALTTVLRDDVRLQMPPQMAWYLGRELVMEFLAVGFGYGGTYRMVPTAANGDAAFGLYRRRDSPSFEPLNLQVLTLGREGVARIDVFPRPGLMVEFGLPERL